MADIQVHSTSQDVLAADTATRGALDQFVRKQRILDHLAQSRRARQSSNFDDKTAVAQARIQRRLAARRQESAVAQSQDIEAARLAQADRVESQEATDPRRTLSGPKTAGDPASAQEWLDSAVRLLNLRWGDSRSTAQTQEAAAEAPGSRRHANFQGPAAAFTGPDQREIAHLEARAKAEKQRADFVAILLENVLSSSTASLIKHQTRLEAMQAQINALQGR
ncbi:MAG TPA: hypothetical protein VFT34_15170 [Verrucomicrobiae bacterium]|nr:hypothetical protein [Verrucomicrobiae bacterium]